MMKRTFICTQGTSIANGCAALREYQGRSDPWEFDDPAFVGELDDRLRSAKKSGVDVSTLSAELNILSAQRAGAGDRLVLLCTDGYLGRICGERIGRMATSLLGMDEGDVEIIRVRDLQVQDAKRLSDVGLKEFVNCARRSIEKYLGMYAIYLCPNGGYKGVVPFLTLLGMQYHCAVLYTFELAKNVVTLPPLPYCFNQRLYCRARRALATLTDKVEMREEQYLSAIEGYQDYERDQFLGFVECSNRPGYVTPSPLVDVFVNASTVRQAMLSRQAFEDLEREKRGNEYLKFCRLILNSQDPVWRDEGGRVHTLPMQTDLIAIKPGHSTLRLLGYFAHGKYYVARVVQHDEYHEAKKNQKKADFPESDFSVWTSPAELEDAGGALDTDETLWEKNDELLSETASLKSEVKDLENQILELESQIEQQKSSHGSLQQERAAYQHQLEEAMANAAKNARLAEDEHQRAEALESELASVRGRLESFEARERLPWYRRIFA